MNAPNFKQLLADCTEAFREPVLPEHVELIHEAWLALQNSLHSETYLEGTLCKCCLVQGRLQRYLEQHGVYLGSPNDGR